MSEEKRVCCICMNEYVPKKKWSLCCSLKCTQERSLYVQRWKRKWEKKHNPPKPKPKKKKKKTLAQISKEAREAGMDYGTYVSLMERSEHGKPNDYI